MSNIDKDFIPYKESEDLKMLGFNEPCFRVLHDETEICRPLYDEGEESLYNSMYDDSRFVANPTYQQAFRWFREKHKQYSYVNELWKQTKLVGYYFSTSSEHFSTSSEHFSYNTPCKSHEEAELDCLRKLIEIVKERTYFTDIYFDDTNKSMSDLEYELQELSKSLYDFDIKYDIQSYYGPIEKGISLSIFDVDGKYIDTTHHRWGWNIKNFMEDEGDIHTLSISENDCNLISVPNIESLLNLILTKLRIITEIKR